MATQKRPKAGIKRGKPNQGEKKLDLTEVYSKTKILDDNRDIDRLNEIFGVTDDEDIQDIIDGNLTFDGY